VEEAISSSEPVYLAPRPSFNLQSYLLQQPPAGNSDYQVRVYEDGLEGDGPNDSSVTREG
jgi:hypothetical protein